MHKLGINYTGLVGDGPERNFALFSQLGFDAVFTGHRGDAELELFSNLAQKHRLFYESIHAPFDHINDIWYEGDAGEAMLKELCDCVKACSRFDIPVAVVHLSSGDQSPCVNDIGRGRFDRLVECAVANNVTIAFENQRKLANLAFVFELYEDVKQVRFCWDVGHEACFAHGREFMPLFGDKLAYTHIHDNLAEYNGDLHMLPFDGKLDFGKCASHIKHSGYQGSLTLEVFQKDARYQGMSAEEFYQRAYAAAVRFRELVEQA